MRTILRTYCGPSASRDTDLLAWFGIYDRCYTFDHRLGTFDSGPPPLALEAQPDRGASKSLTAIGFGLNEQQFTNCIEQIHNWIRAGDVYQLNFTFPLRVLFAEHPSGLYARLVAAQPVDYGAFLHTQAGQPYPVFLTRTLLPH